MRRFASALAALPPGRAIFAAALLAFLLGAPSLFHGFLFDDHVHRYAVKGLPGPMSGLGLFNFAPGDPAAFKPYIENGPFPWWADPEVRLIFFRPLSSALVYLDVALFGETAALWHLHSLLWSVAFVLAGALALRRLTSGALFTVALLFFTFDEARWMPTAWIANRNALIAGTFACLSFALHLRWRQEGTRWAALASALCLALGLCSAEAALAIVGFFLAHALVERRPRSLIPVACVLVPYVVLYKLLRAGAHGSGIYLDPLDAPLAFLAAAPGRFAALVGNMSLDLPIDLWLAAPQAVPTLIGLGALTVVGAGFLLFHTRAALPAGEQRTLDTLLLGTALGLVPTLATFPASRMVLIPGLGAAALLAFVVRHLWRRQRTVFLWLLVAVHVPFAALAWFADQAVLGKMSALSDAAQANLELERDRPDLRVLALTTGDSATGLYTPIQRALSGAAPPARFWILSNNTHHYRFTRVADAALELEALDGHFADTVFEQVVRAPQKAFHVGDQVELAGAQVRVLEVDDGAARKIRVTLDRSLEADDVRLLVWRDGALRRFSPPPVGQRVELPWAEGVMTSAARP